MSASKTTTVTKHDLAALSKAKQEAEFRLVNATVQYQMQKEKKAAPAPEATKPAAKAKKAKAPSKKRASSEDVAIADPAAADAPSKKEKKAKEPKAKPVGWLCEGNLQDGTACPFDAADQIFVGQTNYEKKKHNLCKVCKKAFNKAKKAANDQ